MDTIPSANHRMMNSREWDGILLLEEISDITLDYLLGSGVWRDHCGKFKRDRPKRVNLVRHMTLTQQCNFYREAAFIQRGQT